MKNKNYFEKIEKEWDNWSEMYDIFTEGEGLKDIDFYIKYAKESNGPIFEGGCGTGRLLLPICKAVSHPVYGVDISSGMIGKLRVKLKEHKKQFFTNTVKIIRCNLYEITKEKLPHSYFSLAILGYGIFGYFLSKKDALRVLKNINFILKDHGYLILERRNYQFNIWTPKEVKIFRWAKHIPDRNSIIVHYRSDFPFKKSRQIRHTIFYFDEYDLITGKNKSYRYQLYVRDWTLSDIKEMLLKAGFSILKVYGDYNEGPFIETKSRRIIVIGQKIKETKI